MAVLIPNMEMPSKCLVCPFSYWTEGAHHDYCQAVSYDTELLYDLECRPSWCPLVEIPAKRKQDNTLLEASGFEL